MSATLARPLALVLAVFTAVALVATPAAAEVTYTNVTRVPGDTFADAAVAISQGAFPDGADAAVLATDANFPDALTASALAATVGGPVLFTAPDQLTESTANELNRLLSDASTVYLMGGEAAISEDVEDALVAAGFRPQRVAGPTRLETAREASTIVGPPANGTVVVARAFGPDGANTPSDRTTGWVDAISCGAWAAAVASPLFLTQTDVLSDAAREGIAALEGVTTAVICGGPRAVSDPVADQLRGMGLTVERIAGVTRVETAIAAAQGLFAFGTAGGRTFTVVNGYGENYGYALAAAPLADPILLVGRDEPTACEDAAQPSRETLCYLGTGSAEQPATLRVVGEVSDEVANAAGAAAGGTDVGELPLLQAPTEVTAEDAGNDAGDQLQVSWVAPADPNGILAGYNVYVDGELQGTSPTVAADVTEHVVTELTPDEEVTVTVAAVDQIGREGAQSAPATGTPVDEEPLPVEALTAAAGNQAVLLSWELPEVADLKELSIERAQASDCAGASYSQVATVAEPATSYTDSGLTNGVSYCHRVISVDTNGNTSEPARVGPTVPEEVPVQVAFVTPTTPEGQDGPGQSVDVLHFGYPYEITWETTSPQTPLSELTVVIELLLSDGGVAETPPIFDGTHPSDSKVTWRVAPDINDSDAQMVIKVLQPNGTFARDVAEVALDRAPAPVAGLTVVGGGGVVTVTWDRSPETTTIGYWLERAAVPVGEGGATDSETACSPNNPGADYQRIDADKADPDDDFFPVTVTEYRDTDIRDGSTPFDDVRYCYRAQAIRSGQDLGEDETGAFSPIESVNPDSAEVSVSLSEPDDNKGVKENRDQPVRFSVSVPSGASATQTATMQYCMNYRPDMVAGQPVGDPECQDADGWKPVVVEGDTNEDGTVPAVVQPGTENREFIFTWPVPSIPQADADTGAVRVFIDGNESNASVSSGITFI